MLHLRFDHAMRTLKEKGARNPILSISSIALESRNGNVKAAFEKSNSFFLWQRSGRRPGVIVLTMTQNNPPTPWPEDGGGGESLVTVTGQLESESSTNDRPGAKGTGPT